MLSNPFLKALSHSQLAAAWERVAVNAGAAGVDGVTVQAFGQQRAIQLRALQSAVLGGRYRAAPLRECLIPKAPADPGAAKPLGAMRRLAIPTVADRVLQTAVARCRVNRAHSLSLRQRLRPLLDLSEDSLRWYPLCGASVTRVRWQGPGDNPGDNPGGASYWVV